MGGKKGGREREREKYESNRVTRVLRLFSLPIR